MTTTQTYAEAARRRSRATFDSNGAGRSHSVLTNGPWSRSCSDHEISTQNHFRPQIGFIIPISKEYQGYLNIKGYKDVEAENRASTWSTWVTLAISPAPPETASAKPVGRKY